MLLNKHFVYSGDDDIVGRLSKDDGEGRNENKGRLKSDFGSFNIYRDYSDSLCHMQANSPGAEFLRTVPKFIKKRKISSWLVYFLH